ncbi:MAG: Bax inhibitor-1/YccA family protein [Rhodospirillaceae bacterium]
MATEADRRVYGRTAATTADAVQIDVGLRQYMLRVYNYMASGLFLSGIVALLVNTTGLQNLFFQATESGRVGYTGLGWVAIFAPIGLILWMSFGAQRMKTSTLQAVYWAFVATMGVGLSTILMVYTGASALRVLFISAIAFSSLSMWGYLTKRDLSAMGTFLIMGLVGLLVASLVNIFMQSSMMHFVISAVGVLVFAGLTAYDTQKIKNSYFHVAGSGVAEHAAIMGAVTLYLDFINLFQFLLAFLGQRRE